MKERGLLELASRRRFLNQSLAGTTAAFLGRAIPFARFMPLGYVPVALAEAPDGALLAEKPGLRILNDRPINAETPAHMLDDAVTPASRLFVRNNGIPPTSVDPAGWTLQVHGESCLNPRSFTLAELKSNFKHHTYQLQIECGGNGRAEFRPRTAGNQWSTGAIGCPSWTGVRLRDVLEACGVGDDAVYVAYVGKDTHLSGDPAKRPISRGVPVAKAMEAESLLAFEMNGAPIPALHGAPLRLVCGGWPASVSGKWVSELLVRDRVHDGAKMTGTAYRVPCDPVAPGTETPDENMCIINSMPVKSIITSPESGGRSERRLAVRGHAWAGDLAVASMAVSIDFGHTWHAARLDPPANRLAWQRWQATVRFPSAGYFEVWARATDTLGRTQPMLVPGWNPKGYLNNATHRIAVQVS